MLLLDARGAGQEDNGEHEPVGVHEDDVLDAVEVIARVGYEVPIGIVAIGLGLVDELVVAAGQGVHLVEHADVLLHLEDVVLTPGEKELHKVGHHERVARRIGVVGQVEPDAHLVDDRVGVLLVALRPRILVAEGRGQAETRQVLHGHDEREEEQVEDPEAGHLLTPEEHEHAEPDAVEDGVGVHAHNDRHRRHEEAALEAELVEEVVEQVLAAVDDVLVHVVPRDRGEQRAVRRLRLIVALTDVALLELHYLLEREQQENGDIVL